MYNKRKGVQQCTGNTYHKIATEDPYYDKIDKKIRDVIDEKYQCMGFLEFANRVRDLETSSKNRARYIAKIKLEYSDRVIIIDEVHNIRNNDKCQKIVPPKILEVLQYAERVKLVLLTATPMFNEASEIVWLVNLLLANDNRKLIQQGDIFNSAKSGSELVLTSTGKKNLAAAIRGYISYMRSENPFSFPMRLFPNQSVSPIPILDIKGNPIPAKKRLSNKFVLDTSFMSDYQREIYENLESIHKTVDDDDTTNSVLFQASNIVYPGTTRIGKHGFEDCFTMMRNKKIEYRNREHEGFLSPEKIGKYAPKIKTIIDRILNSTGVIFVYSYYYEGGLVPIALALEHAGFTRYGGSNYLTGSGTHKKRLINGKLATYTILGKQYTNNFHAEVEAARADSNVYGEDIKVILGTSVAAEGIDFRFIREVHILEPWYHLNKLEQIVGRAVRNCSHVALPPSERNVTISYHANRILGRERETVDERHYRLAQTKKIAIDEIETILKENSVDCVLNENALVFDPKRLNIKMDIVTSQGEEIKSVPVGDVQGKYSSIKCVAAPFKSGHAIDDSTFNKSFYLDDVLSKISIVGDIFLDPSVKSLSYNQIRSKVPLQVASDDVLMFTLDYMLTQKVPISNFRLIYRSNLYMLQPLDITDTRIPVSDRGITFAPVKQTNIRLLPSTTNAASSSKLAHKDSNPIEFIIDQVQHIKAELGNVNGYDAVYFEYVVDRLDNAMLRSVAASQVAAVPGPIQNALVSGNWYIPETGWVRDTVDHSKWYKATTGSIVTPRELANYTDMPVIVPRLLHDLTGYMVMDHAKHMPRFKLVDKNKQLSLGFVCDQTTTFSIAHAKDAIEAMDKKKHFDVNKEMNKKTRCMLYEVLLRKENVNFARPVEATMALARKSTKK